jgi:hypothetical protein
MMANGSLNPRKLDMFGLRQQVIAFINLLILQAEGPSAACNLGETSKTRTS